MPRILSYYILRETAVPLALSFVILTLTALLSKVMKIIELMVTHGVGVSFIARFIVAVLPSFVIYTLPISFLIGVLVAFARISSDSELVAMKASGVGLKDLIKPVLALALAVYALSLCATLYLFPWGNMGVKELMLNVARSKLMSGIDEKTFYDKFKGVVLYIDHISPRTGEMSGIFISESSRGGALESNVFFARHGVFAPSLEDYSVYLKLYDGAIHRGAGEGAGYHVAKFSAYILELSLAGDKGAKHISRMNRDLYLDELSMKADAAIAAGKDPAPYIVDLHKRFALPASVFVFALMGVALGVQKVRSARLAGFTVAIGVVLAYYVLSTALEAAGDNGVINPIVSVWGSDVIFGVAGFYLFRRAAADNPVDPLGWARGALSAFWRRKGRKEGP